MDTFTSIGDLIQVVGEGRTSVPEDLPTYRKILKENRELLEVLRTFEEIRPLDQEYHLFRKALLLTYKMPYDFIRLSRKRALGMKIRLVHEYLDLTPGGYLAAEGDQETRGAIGEILRDFAARMKGMTIVVNSDVPIPGGRPYYSYMVLDNRFDSFEDYLGALRHRYRKERLRNLKKGEAVSIRRIDPADFTEEHYQLYRDTHDRTEMISDLLLPLEFFQTFKPGTLYEYRDPDGHLLAFELLLQVQGRLHPLLVGFRRDCTLQEDCIIPSVDLYFLTNLFDIRTGIEQGAGYIDFGQGSENAKALLGCREEKRYIYMTSSNFLVRTFLKLYSRGMKIGGEVPSHRVFRETEETERNEG